MNITAITGGMQNISQTINGITNFPEVSVAPQTVRNYKTVNNEGNNTNKNGNSNQNNSLSNKNNYWDTLAMLNKMSKKESQ